MEIVLKNTTGKIVIEGNKITISDLSGKDVVRVKEDTKDIVIAPESSTKVEHKTLVKAKRRIQGSPTPVRLTYTGGEVRNFGTIKETAIALNASPSAISRALITGMYGAIKVSQL